jgi:DNA-binding transcriptional ArsR family regulator
MAGAPKARPLQRPIPTAVKLGAAQAPALKNRRSNFRLEAALKRLLSYRRMILKHMLNYETPLDRAFQALADPTRRAMVDRLARGPATVSELKRPLVMSLPAVMQHLAVLETSGLVVTQKSGRVRTCRINPTVLAEAERWIAERRLEWERRLDRLGEYLKTLESEGKNDEQDR